MIDTGDEEGVRRASARVTAISVGSKSDADMEISIAKTKVIHVREQEPTTETTTPEARKVCKFTCPHHMCGHQFLTKHSFPEFSLTLTHSGTSCDVSTSQCAKQHLAAEHVLTHDTKELCDISDFLLTERPL